MEYFGLPSCAHMNFLGCFGVENKFDSKEECREACGVVNVLSKRGTSFFCECVCVGWRGGYSLKFYNPHQTKMFLTPPVTCLNCFYSCNLLFFVARREIQLKEGLHWKK